MFYEQITGRAIEKDSVSIISCNGISYKRYLEIAKATDKRIAVITDNDEEPFRIEEANAFNRSNNLQHIFMGATTDEWTWEACIYKVNKDALDEMITVQAGAEYKLIPCILPPRLLRSGCFLRRAYAQKARHHEQAHGLQDPVRTLSLLPRHPDD